MNREIRFRVRDESGKIIGYEWLGSPYNASIGSQAWRHSYTNDPIFRVGVMPWHNYGIREQYTGLKDKNGRMIYEGDIVMTALSDKKIVRHRCIFEDGAFAFQNIDMSPITMRNHWQDWLTDLEFVIDDNATESSHPRPEAEPKT